MWSHVYAKSFREYTRGRDTFYAANESTKYMYVYMYIYIFLGVDRRELQKQFDSRGLFYINMLIYTRALSRLDVTQLPPRYVPLNRYYISV